MEDTIFIQRRFRIIKDGLSLSDALIIPKSEYDGLSEQQISTLKDERFEIHKDHILNPPVIPQPTKAEQLLALEQERKDLEYRWSIVEGKEITIVQSVKGGVK